MLPLLAVGGVIGAVMSIAKGASWLSDQFDSATSSASAGGKADAVPTDAKASSFETTLAAQAAGQAVPPGVSDVASTTMTGPVASPTMMPALHGTDYEALARMRAGLFAYSHQNQNQSDKKDDNPVTGS